MATALKSVQTVAEDDGVRELHGIRFVGCDATIRICEDGDKVRIYAPPQDRILSPRQARYLASRLYRLARRIERREVSA